MSEVDAGDGDGLTVDSRSSATLLRWTEWLPLRHARRNPAVPRAAGLYCIRQPGAEVWDYVGQTGGSLRGRLGMLSGVFGTEMPYRDPHTAGPALWAAMQLQPSELQVSVAAVTDPAQIRLGLECLTITEHRWRTGTSPRWNFGRMPVGFRMSSTNNRRIVEANRRFRGGPTADTVTSHAPGIRPVSESGNNPADLHWGQLHWSPWTEVRDVMYEARGAIGLYRLVDESTSPLIYVGQGRITDRIRQHLAKSRDLTHRQAPLFSRPSLRCSWVGGDWLDHQRLELENDLIANHVQLHAAPPLAQFIG